MILKNLLGVCAGALLSLSNVHAVTVNYTVEAAANSSSGGSALPTLLFNVGDLFTSSADVNDLWTAGANPRWSNADGLVVDLFATGTDETGEAIGTHIGTPFSTWTQDGFTAPYGSLVGRIGSDYKLLGTSYSGPAWGSGVLELMYWDSNNGDNSQSIRVTIATPSTRSVPDAGSSSALLGLGVAGLVALRSRYNRA